MDNQNVIITSGANGAMNLFTQAFIHKHDEVVLFEPFFPIYLEHIKLAGGIIKVVQLKYSEITKTFSIDYDEFRN